MSNAVSSFLKAQSTSFHSQQVFAQFFFHVFGKSGFSTKRNSSASLGNRYDFMDKFRKVIWGIANILRISGTHHICSNWCNCFCHVSENQFFPRFFLSPSICLPVTADLSEKKRALLLAILAAASKSLRKQVNILYSFPCANWRKFQTPR
jgi:hypothetical protein